MKAGKYEAIILEKEDGVATITLNRPEASNAFTLQMFQELYDALENIRLDKETKSHPQKSSFPILIKQF